MLYAVNKGLLFYFCTLQRDIFLQQPPTDDVDMDHLRLALYFMKNAT